MKSQEITEENFTDAAMAADQTPEGAMAATDASKH